MMQEETNATPEVNGAEQAAENGGSPVADGFGEFVSRAVEGDLSAGTWVLFWQSVGQPVLLAVVLIVAVVLAGSWLRRATERSLVRARVEQTLARFLANVVKVLVLVAGGITILGTLGLETTSFAAALAAAGFAIGMALSGTLGNVAAGVMLLLFRPFKVGDAVTVNGITAKVFQINLFNSEFDTFDNRRVIMPNSAVFGNTIENISHHATRRVDVGVGTTYASDIDKAREVLMEAARSTENILTDPAPAVVLTGMGDSSIDWSVRVWVNAADFWPVKDRLTRNVKVALDKAEIGIPFPQMDVHIDGMVRRD
ncbi:MAG: mechanosensitive ion channel family protein [Phycisphaerales bacterium]|nr:mechanosensitive ion channel family protein [Planctomycetota bacterium]MCH8509821.1 mechanosensitive ion channel family protein [Phycisphaerales bacterium]